MLPETEFAKSKLYAEESKAERTIGFISEFSTTVTITVALQQI